MNTVEHILLYQLKKSYPSVNQLSGIDEYQIMKSNIQMNFDWATCIEM